MLLYACEKCKEIFEPEDSKEIQHVLKKDGTECGGIEFFQLKLDVRVVNSNTREGVKYIIRLLNGIPVSCSCPGWTYRIEANPDHKCIHLKNLLPSYEISLSQLKLLD